MVATVIGTAIGLNIIASRPIHRDRPAVSHFPARVQAAGISSRSVLSRVVEDSGTVTSVLIPWNSCGAYHTGVLGISTFDYAPYCFFNIINPIISLIYGFAGIRMEKYAPGEVPPGDEGAVPSVAVTDATPQPVGEIQ